MKMSLGPIFLLFALFSMDFVKSQKVFFNTETTISSITEQLELATESPDVALPVEDCGSEFGRVTKLHLTPNCESNGDGKTCVLQRGTTYYLNATLVPNTYSEELMLHIHQVDPNFGFGTQLHPPKSVCGRFDIECPIYSDVPIAASFSGTFPIELLPIRLVTRIFVTGKNESEIFGCKQLPLDFQ